MVWCCIGKKLIIKGAVYTFYCAAFLAACRIADTIPEEGVSVKLK